MCERLGAKGNYTKFYLRQSHFIIGFCGTRREQKDAAYASNRSFIEWRGHLDLRQYFFFLGEKKFIQKRIASYLVSCSCRSVKLEFKRNHLTKISFNYMLGTGHSNKLISISKIDEYFVSIVGHRMLAYTGVAFSPPYTEHRSEWMYTLCVEMWCWRRHEKIIIFIDGSSNMCERWLIDTLRGHTHTTRTPMRRCMYEYDIDQINTLSGTHFSDEL